MKVQSDDIGDDNTFIVHERRIACSGASSPDDHPLVYYSIMKPGGDGISAVKGDDNSVQCQYCGRIYIYQDGDNVT